MKKIRPLHDRVIVRRLEEERKSAGGIVIPDSAACAPSFSSTMLRVTEHDPSQSLFCTPVARSWLRFTVPARYC